MTHGLQRFAPRYQDKSKVLNMTHGNGRRTVLGRTEDLARRSLRNGLGVTVTVTESAGAQDLLVALRGKI